MLRRVQDLSSEQESRSFPKKRNEKKAEQLSEEALQIAVKRREAKSKGENSLNAKFQRIGRRDKKAFLNNQCKEIEENNRMGKTKDLFKKIRDTKGTFHGKMGSMKKIKLGHSFFPLFNLSANYILLNSKFKV